MVPARPESLARVAVRIREELGHLEQVTLAVREALEHPGATSPELPVTHWVGGLVHDFYTGLEKAFTEISPEINGLEPARDTWHRQLLHAMTLDLPGLRPPVVRRDLEPRLAELSRFRHLYRNLYSFQLRWDRVRALADETLALWPEVRADLEAFAAAMDAIARG